MTMYQVFCIGTARRWLPYSREFRTLNEAEECMRYATNAGARSVQGKPIRYKIVTRETMEEEFDLQAYLLGNIYPQMDEADIAGWSLAQAETLASDLHYPDAQEIYNTIAEFAAQDGFEIKEDKSK